VSSPQSNDRAKSINRLLLNEFPRPIEIERLPPSISRQDLLPLEGLTSGNRSLVAVLSDKRGALLSVGCTSIREERIALCSIDDRVTLLRGFRGTKRDHPRPSALEITKQAISRGVRVKGSSTGSIDRPSGCRMCAIRFPRMPRAN